MSYLINISDQDLTFVGSIARQALGTLGFANDGVYQFVQNKSTAITQYFGVKIDETYAITAATGTNLPTTEPAAVGIAQQSGGFPLGSTTTQFGWVFVGPGLATCSILASCVQKVKLLSSATPGAFDDSGTATVQGLTLITTIVGAANVPVWATQKLVTACQD